MRVIEDVIDEDRRKIHLFSEGEKSYRAVQTPYKNASETIFEGSTDEFTKSNTKRNGTEKVVNERRNC